MVETTSNVFDLPVHRRQGVLGAIAQEPIEGLDCDALIALAIAVNVSWKAAPIGASSLPIFLCRSPRL